MVKYCHDLTLHAKTFTRNERTYTLRSYQHGLSSIWNMVCKSDKVF